MRRDFTGPDDLSAMQTLASRLWTPASRFHPGQLAWNRHFRPVDPYALDEGEAISIWSGSDGETLGFGWAEAPDWLELQVDPAHPEVADEVVDWFEEASDSETQSALVMEGDIVEKALTAAGFAPDTEAPFFTHHTLDLTATPDPRDLPPGYGVRRVVKGEARERAAVHAASWSDVSPSQVEEGSYTQLMATWPYRPELDWVVTDRDGTMVASALVWLDPSTGAGLLEPVGCVPGHRGQGLASLVTVAALHALRAAGGSVAQVSPRGDAAYPGPQRLYRSLGFTPVARTVTWTRSLD